MKKLLLLLIISIGVNASAVVSTNVSRGTIYNNTTNAASILDGVITAGEAGQSSGSFAIADQSAGFEIQTLTFSNNLPSVISLTATNYPVMTSVANTNVMTRDATEMDRLLTRIDNTGWANYADTQYVSTNHLVVANARTLYTIDGLGAGTNTNYLPAAAVSTGLFNTTSNFIVSSSIGNAFDIRLQFTAEATSLNTEFDIEFDIGAFGSTTNVISAKAIVSPKGTDPNAYIVTVPVYSLGDFVTNGCRIYINTKIDGSTWDFWDLRLFIKEDYYE